LFDYKLTITQIDHMVNDRVVNICFLGFSELALTLTRVKDTC